MTLANNVLVAVDGSDASQEALDQAVMLARQGRMVLTGVFVIDAGWPDYIGNDWQSARGARQGFLDYVRSEQEQQAAVARIQFDHAVRESGPAEFIVKAGDPTSVLMAIARDEATNLLVLSRRVFQVSGRPSLKSLSVALARTATRPLLLLP